jgi:DNA-binding NtrC family response regulator
VKKLTAPGERALLAGGWPGNVRELRNAIDRACVMSAGDYLASESLFDDGGETLPQELPQRKGADLYDYLRICERDHIEAALAEHEGRIAATAEALGLSRKNLWERMKRLGMNPGE